MAKRAGLFRVGTSGWVYKHWRGAFYPVELPAKRWFPFYREHFASVELNTPFYHLPKPASVARWRDETPPGFAFSVKGSRFITHNKKLKDPVAPLERFFELLDGLGGKIAVVLWQLPPSWGFDGERLDAFLRAFRARERDRRTCFEFRNAAWYAPESLEILRRWNAGFCIYDLAGHTSPLELTADFAYVRLHGNAGKYAGEYGERGLAPWAERIRAWLASGIDVFAYFDNDYQVAAPRDAATLARLVGEQRPRAARAGDPRRLRVDARPSTGRQPGRRLEGTNVPEPRVSAPRRARPAPRTKRTADS
jgi:uncharacterized protein YecE (DUF72 family)